MATEIASGFALPEISEAASPPRSAPALQVWRNVWPKAAAVGRALAAWQVVVWSGWKPDYVLRGRAPEWRRPRAAAAGSRGTGDGCEGPWFVQACDPARGVSLFRRWPEARLGLCLAKPDGRRAACHRQPPGVAWPAAAVRARPG